MLKNKTKLIPNFYSLDKWVTFFENHDIGEYWDQMPEANFKHNH